MTWLKWVLTVCSVVIAIVAVVSLRFQVLVYPGNNIFVVGNGSVRCAYGGHVDWDKAEWYFENAPWRGRIRSVLGVPEIGATFGFWFVTVPLWLPFLVCSIPALILWRRRPKRPGRCKCGYDLTGNTSGRCPECGAAVGPASQGAR